jgi:hypothetical protein
MVAHANTVVNDTLSYTILMQLIVRVCVVAFYLAYNPSLSISSLV